MRQLATRTGRVAAVLIAAMVTVVASGSLRSSIHAFSRSRFGTDGLWAGHLVSWAATLWLIGLAAGLTWWALAERRRQRRWVAAVVVLGLGGGMMPYPETVGMRAMVLACHGDACLVAARFHDYWVKVPQDWQVGTPITLWTSPLLGAAWLRYESGDDRAIGAAPAADVPEPVRI